MKKLTFCVLLLAITFSVSDRAYSQELSPVDREKLKLVEEAADRFVERFCQTLDFGTVWREFHMSDISCTIKASGFFSENDYKRLKFDDELLNRLYVASRNYYYLRGAYGLSIIRMDSELSDESFIPKKIRREEGRAKYVKENGKEPENVGEREEMIVELNHLAGLYRKYLPQDVMRSRAWQANLKYFAGRNWDHTGVTNGNSTLCVPDNVKVYIAERSMFHFYFVEENGKMKVAGLGIGN